MNIGISNVNPWAANLADMDQFAEQVGAYFPGQANALFVRYRGVQVTAVNQ